MNGKSIKIFLAEGEPNGVLTAEIMNWTGKMMVTPRSKLSQLAKREEARRASVYVLTGDDENTLSRKKVYVGESDNVFRRLADHEKDESKDFWTHNALIISKDLNLTKAHTRYLESRLLEIIEYAGRATLVNGTKPEKYPLPEPDTADMEEFLANVSMLMPVLGFSFTQPPPTREDQYSTVDSREISPTFFMSPVGTKAFAREINGEFVILKNSTARKEDKAGASPGYRLLREQLREEGKLQEEEGGQFLIFAEDVPFTSPSAAASVVNGNNLSGPLSWKIEKSNKTYRQWQEDKLKEIESENNAESGL